MIIKGGPVTNWGLGKHLTAEKNEVVRLIGSRGILLSTIDTAITDLDGERFQMQAKKNLAHFHVSPHGTLSEQQWAAAWQHIEEEYDLGRSSYVEVEHRKEGRTHRHRVYSRLDPEAGRAISFSFTKRRNEKLGHELAVAFGHELILGSNTPAIIKQWESEGRSELIAAVRFAEERERVRAPEGSESDASSGADKKARKRDWAEHQQESRSGQKLSGITAAVGFAWGSSDTGLTFHSALLSAGLQLAIGDRGGFVVVVDESGVVYSVSRALRRAVTGFDDAAMMARLTGIKRGLPSVLQAQEYQRTKISPGLEQALHASEEEHEARRARSEARSRSDAMTLAIGRAWTTSSSALEFQRALEVAGYQLAKGDRRGIVVVDALGEFHGLLRVLKRFDKSVDTKTLRTRFPDLHKDLPTVGDAIARQRDRAAEQGQPFPSAGHGRSSTSHEMPDEESVRTARRDRAREAAARRRKEERDARKEIHDLAADRVRAEYVNARAAHFSDIKTHKARRWSNEQDQRRKAHAAMTDAERRERDLIYRTTKRGLIRTVALALHRRLSRISRDRLRRDQAVRWDAVKLADTAPARPISFDDFLRQRAHFDDVARWLRDRTAQRAQYRAERQKEEMAKKRGNAHERDQADDRRPDPARPLDDGPTKNRGRGPSRGS